MKVTEILPPEQKAAGSNPAEGTNERGSDQHNAGTGPFFGPATAPQTAPYEPNSSAETIPAWEATARRSGLLPAVGADTVRDPEYIRARLQESITRAAASVADIDQVDRHVVAAELKVLRRYIERLAEELRPYSRTGEEMLADLNRAHPGVSWCPVTSGFSGSSDGSGDDAAVAAALALRLPEVEPSWGHCVREWRGVIEGWQVFVFVFRPYTQR